MELSEKVVAVIYQAFDELNPQLDEGQHLAKSRETVLFGPDAELDSLGLVNAIVMIEEKIHDAFGKSITLADERALAQVESPFRTVEALTQYICMLLREQGTTA